MALTWQEALKIAADKSNEIKSAKKQLDAYQWFYGKSFSAFLPQISANAGQSNSTNSIGNSTSYSYGISATQSLFKGFQNYFNVESAGINYDYYKANLTNAKANYYCLLRQAYVDLYLAQQNLIVRKRIKQSRENNARMMKLFYGRGKEDKGNYLRTEAQYLDADQGVSNAMRALELAKLKISQLLNTEVSTIEGELSVQVAPSLPDFDPLSKTTPVYLMAKDQLALAEINQQQTISEFLPSVSLSGSYQKSDSVWPPNSSSKSLSLSASLPIFPGGSNFADRAAYGLLLEKAKEDFQKNQKDNFFAIKQAYENLKDAIEVYGVQKLYVESSSQRARISQAKYLNGLTAFNDWDIIQTSYVNDQISLLNSNRNALLAEANWYKSYGGWVK